MSQNPAPEESVTQLFRTFHLRQIGAKLRRQLIYKLISFGNLSIINVSYFTHFQASKFIVPNLYKTQKIPLLWGLWIYFIDLRGFFSTTVLHEKKTLNWLLRWIEIGINFVFSWRRDGKNKDSKWPKYLERTSGWSTLFETRISMTHAKWFYFYTNPAPLVIKMFALFFAIFLFAAECLEGYSFLTGYVHLSQRTSSILAGDMHSMRGEFLILPSISFFLLGFILNCFLQ